MKINIHGLVLSLLIISSVIKFASLNEENSLELEKVNDVSKLVSSKPKDIQREVKFPFAKWAQREKDNYRFVHGKVFKHEPGNPKLDKVNGRLIPAITIGSDQEYWFYKPELTELKNITRDTSDDETLETYLPYTVLPISMILRDEKVMELFGFTESGTCNAYPISHVKEDCMKSVQHMTVSKTGLIGACSIDCSDGKVFEGIGCVDHECEQTSFEKMGDASCQVRFEALSDKAKIVISRSSFGLCEVKLIDGYQVINNCEEMSDGEEEVLTWIKDVDGKIYYLERSSFSRWQNLTDINSYFCGGRCSIESCRRGKCSGDLTYCKSLGCVKVSDCICAYKSSTDTVIVKVDGVVIRPMCWGTTTAVIKRRKESLRDGLLIPCDKCVFICTSKGLIGESPERRIRMIRVCKNPHCMDYYPETKSFFIEFTSQMSTANGKLFIEIWFFGSVNPYEMTTSCEHAKICDSIECVLCLERWINFECFYWWMWMIITAVVLLEAYGVYSLASALHKKLSQYKGHKSIKPLFQTVWGSCKILKTEKTRTVKTKNEEVELEPIERKKKTTKQQTRRLQVDYKDLIFVAINILTFMITGGICCTHHQELTAQTSSCITSSDSIESCSVTHSIRLALAPIGQLSCYTIKDHSAKVIGSLTFETKSVDLKCNEEILYYAPNAVHECKSTRNCGGTSACSGNRCASVKVDEVFSHWGEANNKMGWTGCKQSCGCASCGCFVCTPACHFYRAYFTNPTREVYKVFDCPSWSYLVKVRISKITVNDTTIKDVELVVGSEIQEFGINLGLIGISVPQAPILNKCFMKNQKTVAVVECAKKDSIVKGMVGEIQCPSEKDAEYTTKKCHGDNNLISVNEANEEMTCNSRVISLKQEASDNSLPRRVGEVNLIPFRETVIASFTGNSLFEIQLDMKDFNLIAKSDMNKCFVIFMGLSGCYSCSQGATLTLKHHTNFGNALGHFICKELGLSIPILVNNGVETKNYTFPVNTRNINTDCEMICPDSSTQVNVKGLLQISVSSDFIRSNQTMGVEVNSPSGFTVDSIFQVDWLRTSITSMTTIILLVIGGILVLHIIRAIFGK